MGFVLLNERGKVVGIWRRNDIVRMLADVQICLLVVAYSRLPILVICNAGNIVERVTAA